MKKFFLYFLCVYVPFSGPSCANLFEEGGMIPHGQIFLNTLNTTISKLSGKFVIDSKSKILKYSRIKGAAFDVNAFNTYNIHIPLAISLTQVVLTAEKEMASGKEIPDYEVLIGQAKSFIDTCSRAANKLISSRN